MGDLSDVQKGQIIEAYLAGASITLIAQLFGVLRTTVRTTYTKHGKTSSEKKNNPQLADVLIDDIPLETIQKLC
uniref:Resolvase HTH domain-containing protein n=1 Tax=Sinocyclocheilus rhinocerous TaxID=307959 RepID=A0A673GJD8_9TELE